MTFPTIPVAPTTATFIFSEFKILTAKVLTVLKYQTFRLPNYAEI
ncbi:hypothetical protein C723_0434 [Christiangramia flava JLT2011]|uniref:Uncharacterized protein n=1 Tax=Christiangramia flava JLT2011 TaxID=1229726 RepID=A0A1L7I3I8_9FLAO|nr:hypothetical protein GRFL_1464 [Christiangramia flava JLT2011]OSS41025.1 hypothetical protein C723_0434 [Christiangramia flava JLT2011]